MFYRGKVAVIAACICFAPSHIPVELFKHRAKTPDMITDILAIHAAVCGA